MIYYNIYTYSHSKIACYLGIQHASQVPRSAWLITCKLNSAASNGNSPACRWGSFFLGCYTVCVQIFAGCIFRKRPAPNNFRDINFTYGSLQLQTCTALVKVWMRTKTLIPYMSQKYLILSNSIKCKTQFT